MNVGDSRAIRTSTFLVTLALSAASCLACAQGTEISPGEIVVLQLLPPADAGVDAGVAPLEQAAFEQAAFEQAAFEEPVFAQPVDEPSAAGEAAP